jgi:autotransporter translocation and assembly factor TamB
VKARLSFSDNAIRLDTLTAVQHSAERVLGRVWAHGEVRLDPDRPRYHFKVSLRDFTASELGLYAARFNGDFDVVDGAKVEGEVLPHITSDNVEIDRAVILYDFARQSEAEQVEASTQKQYWTYRIRVHATDNLRWQPADGDIEFACDLNLDQSVDKLVIFGDMEALRGTYYFLSNRFNVTRAKLTFDNVSGVDPTIDAEATTRLTPSMPVESYYSSTGAPSASGTPASPKPYDITVTISGRASQPVVAFDSQPTESGARKLDQAEILRELTVGRFAASNQNFAGLADPLDSYLTRAISRQLSGELSRAFRGYITDWEIARESGGLLGQGGLVVGVGTQVNSRVALRYRQVVPGTTISPINPNTITQTNQVERDIEAEYRINRFFSITSQLLQKRTVTGTTTTVSGTPDFNVNLKARWEY